MKSSRATQRFFPCFNAYLTANEQPLIFCDSNTSDQADILMLHGGGLLAGLHHYAALRQDLYNLNITSCAFDFIGQGKSKGVLTDSCLAQRTEEAYEVTASGRLKSPMTIVGTSMGAYTALKLTELCHVSALVLIVPAAYTKQAYEACFKDEFTKIIREPMSWLHSDAWEIIERFKGSLLIITAENDEVVPHEIPSRLYDSAKNAKSRFLYTVPKCPHKMLTFLREATSERAVVADLIKKCHQHNL